MKHIAIITALLLLPAVLFAQNQATVAEAIIGSKPGVDVISDDGSIFSKFDIFIRGYNGVNSDSQPLLILNGTFLNPNCDVDTPFWEANGLVYSGKQNSLLGIDPGDIESIEILSDLNATALYGSKGANGVVIIKTKSAQKRGVTFDVSAGATIQGDSKTFIDRYSIALDDVRNNNAFHLSALFKRLGGIGECGRTGGFQLGFQSNGNKAVQVGFNSSTSLSNLMQQNFRDITNGDYEDDARDIRTINSIFLNISPGKFFSIRADAGLDYRLKRRYVWYGPESLFGALNNAAASLSEIEQFQYNVSLKAEYARYFGKNYLKASAFADFVSQTPDFGVLCGYDFFMYTLKAKGINNAANSSTNRSHSWNEMNIGTGLNVHYDWNGVCGVNGTFRADFNPYFKDKVATVYPAGDIFFDVARLAFKDSRSINKIKLSAGYGQAGKESQMPYVFASEVSGSVPEVDTELRAFYDAAIRVRSQEFNAGLSLAFFRERLSFDAKYYSKKTEETLSLFCNGREFGKDGFWKYADQKEIHSENALISNQGVELSLEGVPVKTKTVNWKIGVNASYNFNIVDNIDFVKKQTNALTGVWMMSSIPTYRTDKLIGYLSDENGYPVDLTGDGEITEADMTILGNTRPTTLLNISTTLDIEKFRLQGKVGMRFGADYVDYEAFFKDGGKYVTSRYVHSENFIPFQVSASYDISIGKTTLRPFVSASNGIPAMAGYLAQKHVSVMGGLNFNF